MELRNEMVSLGRWVLAVVAPWALIVGWASAGTEGVALAALVCACASVALAGLRYPVTTRPAPSLDSVLAHLPESQRVDHATQAVTRAPTSLSEALGVPMDDDDLAALLGVASPAA